MALIASAVLIVAMLPVSGWAWATLPSDAQLPVHWGIEGRPDRYGGKAEALLLVPALAVVLNRRRQPSTP